MWCYMWKFRYSAFECSAIQSHQLFIHLKNLCQLHIYIFNWGKKRKRKIGVRVFCIDRFHFFFFLILFNSSFATFPILSYFSFFFFLLLYFFFIFSLFSHFYFFIILFSIFVLFYFLIVLFSLIMVISSSILPEALCALESFYHFMCSSLYRFIFSSLYYFIFIFILFYFLIFVFGFLTSDIQASFCISQIRFPNHFDWWVEYFQILVSNPQLTNLTQSI